MNINNAMKLLGLMTILTIASVTIPAYAATSVTIDTPTDGSFVNDSDVIGWSWDTDATDGTIVFTQSGGPPDPNSPHTYTMNASDLLASGNPHTILVSALNADVGFSAGGGLVDGVTYDIVVSSPTDAVSDTITGVTYDITPPQLTILGDNPANIPWGEIYTDAGATATDAVNGNLTGSITTSGLGFDTKLIGAYLQTFSYSVTYTVTDSSGNTAQATRIVNVGLKPAEGRSCGGDCYHPHFGVDQNGKVFYDDGLMIDNLQYKIDNVLHNPYSALYLNVGEPVTFKLKAMDNTANQIRHMELALSIPKGDFDKQKAQVIIDLNLGWDGTNTISYEGDKSLVSNVSSDVSKTDKTVTWALTLTPTQKLDHDMFALSVVDEYQYVGTYYINEGIKITGISQNGVPEFDYLDAKGYNHHLTIVDQTLEDLSVAIDEQGHKWTLDSKTQFWMKEFIRPDMKCSVSSSGYSRNCVTEFHEAKLIEQAKATEIFDSSKLQKNIGDSKTIMPGGYGRLHDPVPNMMKAYADYAIWKASHS